MASIEQLETALRNAHRAGDKRSAKALAAELSKAKSGGDGSVLDTFRAYSDAAGTILSNVGGAIVGSTYGLAKGLYNAVDEGTYGTQEGVNTVRRTMSEVTDSFSKGDAYTPEGQAVLDRGYELVSSVAEPIMEWDRDAKILEPLAALPGSPLAPAYRTLAVASGAPVVARNTARVVGDAAHSAATAPVRAAQSIASRVSDPPANSRSVGSAETSKAAERITTARGLPVPFEGESGLTRGQATRDAGQLKFETEAVRDNNRPMQDRRRNQQAVANQNFDRMEEDIGAPRYGSLEEQGAAVRDSLVAYKKQRWSEVQDAYKDAREAGEMSAVVPAEKLADANLTEIFQQAYIERGINPMNEPVFREAMRLNIIDERGNLKPVNADQLETFRKFVNNAYDVQVPNEARQRGIFVRSIDSAMDSIDAGPAYKAAREKAHAFYDEFENSPLARDLDKNAGRSNSPRVADENISKKVASASNAQVRQLRDTLTSTRSGQETWKSIQAEFLNDIRRSAFGTQTSDLEGIPLLNAATFKRKVSALDQSGKLETILGPQQAQYIRDLVEVAEAIATLPPQSVNPGTAAELFRRLRELAPSAGKFGLGAGLEMSIFGGLPVGTMAAGGARAAANAAKIRKSLDAEGLLSEGMK